jgi:hypothetical protein
MLECQQRRREMSSGELNEAMDVMFGARDQALRQEGREEAAKICEEMAAGAEKTRDEYRQIARSGGDEEFFSGAAHDFSLRADALREAAARIRGEG